MRTKRLALWALFAVLLFPIGFAASPGNAAPEPPQAEGKVTLQDITYDDLGKVIRSHKGKVIVVDFWGEY
jgi:hypothetical protein